MTDRTAELTVDEELRQNWGALQMALNSTPDFAYVIGLDGRFKYVNRALLSLWQKTISEAVGKNFYELDYPTELADRLQRQIQQVIETKALVRDRTPYTGPTGETRHYDYIFVPVFGSDGLPTAVTGLTRDITEQVKGEEERVKSEERLTLALAAGGGIGTWDWDVSADRVYCNLKFAELYGLDRARLAEGYPLMDFTRAIDARDRERVEEQIQAAIRTGGDYVSEYRIEQGGGGVKWVLARGRCHYDAGGKAARFPGVVFDVTDRKEAEEALFESEQQFRTLAESIPNLAWIADQHGDIFWYNRRWYEYTGKRAEEMLGWGWQAVHDPAMLPKVLAKWKDALASGEPFDMVFPLRRADGVMRSFLTRVQPVKDSRQNVVRWFGTNTDITEQQNKEEQLRRKNRELEEFAYVASHDLQEPLRMVNIYTQLILRRCETGDDDLKRYADFVHRGVARMATLLHDLLTFSRTVHEDELPVGTADLARSLEDASAILKSRLEEAGGTIVAAPLPRVRGETDQLAHVFQNILANALKYRRESVAPLIEISAAWEQAAWVISVKDNGIGFDPQYAQQIFGLFKRLHKDEYEGTGLGLAICKRIVERYGGKIWAEGKAGEGATFRFSLAAAGGADGDQALTTPSL